MCNLTIHVVGAGALGLAYGYLLNERRHHVFHTSLRGIQIPRLQVALQSARHLSRAWYEPCYRHDTHQEETAHVNIFAVHGTQISEALGKGGNTLSPPVFNLVFCSDPEVIEAGWRQVSTDIYTLVYPLLSSEYFDNQVLRIITNFEVEVCAPHAMTTDERMALAALFNRMGLTVSAWVDRPRFRTRYLQTAAVYTAMFAVGIGMINRDLVDAALLSEIHEELALMPATPHYPASAVEVTSDQHLHYPLLAALIATGEQASAKTLLAENLGYLINKGHYKLKAHLAPIAPAWKDHLAHVSSPTAIQGLISAVLAQCSS